MYIIQLKTEANPLRCLAIPLRMCLLGSFFSYVLDHVCFKNLGPQRVASGKFAKIRVAYSLLATVV